MPLRKWGKNTASTYNFNEDIFLDAPNPPPRFCPEPGVIYQPLAINSLNTVYYVEDIQACQDLCRGARECGFYTFYTPLKTCHLALPTAEKVPAAPGFFGGPAACQGSGGAGGSRMDVRTTTMDRMCFSHEARWFPANSTTFVEGPLDCQEECRKTDWCEHFTFNLLVKACDLHEASATKAAAVAYQLSGPPECHPGINFRIRLFGMDFTKISETIIRQLKQDVAESLVEYFGQWKPYRHGILQDTHEMLLYAQNITLDTGAKTTTDVTFIVHIRTTNYRAPHILKFLADSTQEKIISRKFDVLMAWKQPWLAKIQLSAVSNASAVLVNASVLQNFTALYAPVDKVREIILKDEHIAANFGVIQSRSWFMPAGFLLTVGLVAFLARVRHSPHAEYMYLHVNQEIWEGEPQEVDAEQWHLRV
ncbi:unnamed protein product [Polarella glacialis]|uniref:Apple domain-containing protein n=1 Tax=Polarella glacialis TaxID=89957 RepID=A0A813HLQ7_POLGL|nr:unnamed protein product [Polarella glacialis]